MSSWGSYGRLGAASAASDDSSMWSSYFTIAQAVSDPSRRLAIWKQRYALVAALGAPPAVLARLQVEIDAAQKAIDERETALAAADQWNVTGQAVLVGGVAAAAALVYFLLRRA